MIHLVQLLLVGSGPHLRMMLIFKSFCPVGAVKKLLQMVIQTCFIKIKVSYVHSFQRKPEMNDEVAHNKFNKINKYILRIKQ